MLRTRRRLVGALCALATVGALVAPAVAQGANASAQHVILLSVDGLHQGDLAWYITAHPNSALATLVSNGREFSNAMTPFPSDSFPGLTAQVTGGSPKTTGVYYDDSWNRSLLPPGTGTPCAAVTPGTEVTYFEDADKNKHRLDAGQTPPLSGLPNSILGLTGQARDLIDATKLPVDPATCTPVYPHSYVKVNTIFEVARAAGMRTAWSDKHPAYDLVNGPSGNGVQDLFTPEINSDAPNVGDPIDWTADNNLTRQYDGYKVQAVINEINGFDHSGTNKVGTPAIFGMNFQSVSTAQKLPTSNGQPGGYNEDGSPGTLLQGALDYVNQQVGAMRQALTDNGLAASTVIILSAKHGQSPVNQSAVNRIDDGPIIDKINSDWAATHSGVTLVAFAIDDDGMLIWLTDRSAAAIASAKASILGFTGPVPVPGTPCPSSPPCNPYGADYNKHEKQITTGGIQADKLYGGQAAADFMGVPLSNDRVPDIIGIAQYGVTYTGKYKKIAEHGGNATADRNVPIVVSGAAVGNKGQDATAVSTTQIAPTIVSLLGLSPTSLQAVGIEGTGVLGITAVVTPGLPAAGSGGAADGLRLALLAAAAAVLALLAAPVVLRRVR